MAGAAQGVTQIFTAATLHTLTGEDPPAFATLGQWVDVARLRGMFPGAPVHDFGDRVLVPGFNGARCSSARSACTGAC